MRNFIKFILKNPKKSFVIILYVIGILLTYVLDNVGKILHEGNNVVISYFAILMIFTFAIFCITLLIIEGTEY